MLLVLPTDPNGQRSWDRWRGNGIPQTHWARLEGCPNNEEDDGTNQKLQIRSCFMATQAQSLLMALIAILPPLTRKWCVFLEAKLSQQSPKRLLTAKGLGW